MRIRETNKWSAGGTMKSSTSVISYRERSIMFHRMTPMFISNIDKILILLLAIRSTIIK